MDVIYPRCCGLDVHKREVVACVVSTNADGTPRKAIRAFGTMTPDILALGDWLATHEVTHVAMESTGVYWKPIWNLPACSMGRGLRGRDGGPARRHRGGGR